MFERLKSIFRTQQFIPVKPIKVEQPKTNIFSKLSNIGKNADIVLESGERLTKREQREVKRLEKRWNKAHSKYWNRFQQYPIFSGGEAQDMSVAQYNAQSKSFRSRFRQPLYQRNVDFSKIRDKRQLEKIKETMIKELSLEYHTQRIEQFNENIRRNIGHYGDETLEAMFESLSDRQKALLQDTTLFMSDFYELIPSKDDLTEEQLQRMHERVRRMKAEITRVSKL